MMTAFRDLPIRRKMTAAILGTTTAALILACLVFFAYARVSFRKSIVRNLEVLSEVLARNSTAALSFEDSGEDAAKETLDALRAEPAVMEACLYGGDAVQFATYTRTGERNRTPARPAADGTQIGKDYVVIIRPVMLNEKRLGTLYLRADLVELNLRLRKNLEISGYVLLGSFLVALALSMGLQRLILRPVLALTETAKGIAQTRDYSARATKLSGDELGLLADAFNQMLDDIQERTGALQLANESLRAQAGEMSDAAGVLASSAVQIVTATRELAASAAEAASAVSQTTTTVEEVRQTSQLSSERAKAVSDQAQHAADVAEGGKLSVNQTIEGMNGIRDQMAAIAECILSLSAQSQTIGEIIASVDDLAAQSKLLAVNAAIEAAKAGDEGRGFSVVAQEVKTLAEQSKQATTQVRGILSEIQKATGSAVLATEQGGKAVEAGVQQSAATGHSITALAESIAGAAQAAAQIAATSRQQFAGMEQVAMAMESIKSASAQTVTSTRQVEGAARQLQELGEKLKHLVGEFKV